MRKKAEPSSWNIIPQKQTPPDWHRLAINPTRKCRMDVYSISIRWSMLSGSDLSLMHSPYYGCWGPGGHLNIKMPSYQHRKSHCGDKTMLRPFYLRNGISYTGKMTSLYWIRALATQGTKASADDLWRLNWFFWNISNSVSESLNSHDVVSWGIIDKKSIWFSNWFGPEQIT